MTHSENLGQSHNSFSDATVRFFLVSGAQRTGTNILREILNTNEQIAMLGEVLSPGPAPAQWDNFCQGLPLRRFPPTNIADAESLLDQYFDFVLYRIHNHWEGNRKRRSRAIGIDIKYNQLRRLAPVDWDSTATPFLVYYMRSRGATLIHTTRRNVIHCAISALIAEQRKLWHNYERALVDRSYAIDVRECLNYARMILRDRDAFLRFTRECRVVDCCYEDLIGDIARAEVGEEIPEGPGPLREIAKTLRVSFSFRYDGRLQKTINVPYSRLLSNYDVVVEGVKESEFSALASTLA